MTSVLCRLVWCICSISVFKLEFVGICLDFATCFVKSARLTRKSLLLVFNDFPPVSFVTHSFSIEPLFPPSTEIRELSISSGKWECSVAVWTDTAGLCAMTEKTSVNYNNAIFVFRVRNN